MRIMPEMAPVVPDQLRPYMDDEFMAVHERWRDTSLEDMRQNMPQPVATEYGRAVILDPSGDRDETRTVVLGLPHQQAWKPSMAIRAEFMRQVVAPASRMIVFPNNTVGDRYYNFSDNEAATIESGNLAPFFEQRVRILEELSVKGSIDLTGYSLGGMTAVGIAGVEADNWSVRVLNADEPPNAPRTPKELQRDFMKSGGWGEQRAAIADAQIPALEQELTAPRLAADYARFGLATLIAANKTLHEGMARENFDQLVVEAGKNHPAVIIKLGYVVGSRVFDVDVFNEDGVRESLPESNLSLVAYSGEGARLHPTGDNIVAHTLMFKHAEAQASAD
jgi:hypothetical protein